MSSAKGPASSSGRSRPVSWSVSYAEAVATTSRTTMIPVRRRRGAEPRLVVTYAHGRGARPGALRREELDQSKQHARHRQEHEWHEHDQRHRGKDRDAELDRLRGGRRPLPGAAIRTGAEREHEGSALVALGERGHDRLGFVTA